MTMPTVVAGQIWPTNNGPCKVLKYVNNLKVRVKFRTGYKTWCSVSSLKRGHVKDYFYPTVYGVGYPGGPTSNKRLYAIWKQILYRCYVSKNLPTYEKCTVHSRWLNFQNFCTDVQKMPNFDSGFDLDKDLKILGNKTYGPKTCVFIPHDINILMAGGIRRKRSTTLPSGVVKVKGGYASQLSVYGQTTMQSKFSTARDAHVHYCKCKIQYIRDQIKKFKDVLDNTVYRNLRNLTWDYFYELERK